MGGHFISGRFRFQEEGSDWVDDQLRGFHEELTDENFDLRLIDTGKVPDLGGAPIASWLLARLSRLMGDGPGFDGVEHNDGGGFAFEFVVSLTYVEPVRQNSAFVQPLLFDMKALGLHVEPDRPVASIQFQANMEGAAILGQRAPDCSAEEVLGALAAAFLAASNDLVCRELIVKDPDWKHDPSSYTPWPVKGSRNRYGWDATKFLGQDNIRERRP